jgi:membrane protein required for colicin V production
MNILDLILLIPMLFALYRGFKKGLVYMAASLAALILGILGAIRFRAVFASLLDSIFNIDPSHMNTIAFAVAFISIVIVVHLLAFFADRLIRAVALNFVNRALGMAFGVLITAFIISMVLWPVNQVNAEREIIKKKHIEGSLLYKPLSAFAPAVFPYLKKTDWKEYIPREKKERREPEQGTSV